MAHVMQRQGGVHGGLLAHVVLRDVHRLLGHFEGEGGLFRDAVSHGQGEWLQFGAGDDVVDHAQAVRLLGRPYVGREQELLGLAYAQLIRVIEVFHAAHTHGDDRIHEAGVVAGDDEITDPGQHQTAGDALAMDHGDGGLGQIPPTAAHAEENLLFEAIAAVHAAFPRRLPGAHEGVFELAEALEIVTGGEVRAFAAQQHHLDLLVLRGLVETGVQIIGHAVVLGIPRLGAVLHDLGDMRRDHLVGGQGEFVLHVRLRVVRCGFGAGFTPAACRRDFDVVGMAWQYHTALRFCG